MLEGFGGKERPWLVSAELNKPHSKKLELQNFIKIYEPHR
jgi:hypothetical protein